MEQSNATEGMSDVSECLTIKMLSNETSMTVSDVFKTALSKSDASIDLIECQALKSVRQLSSGCPDINIDDVKEHQAREADGCIEGADKVDDSFIIS